MLFPPALLRGFLLSLFARSISFCLGASDAGESDFTPCQGERTEREREKILRMCAAVRLLECIGIDVCGSLLRGLCLVSSFDILDSRFVFVRT